MKKLVIISLVCVLALAGAAVSQDCGSCQGNKATIVKVAIKTQDSCQDAKQDAKTLTTQIAALEAGAAKGCEASKTRLAALRKACGTDCDKTMKVKVAKYEKYAASGCGESAKALKAIAAVLKIEKKEKPLLSARVATLTKSATAGCKSSKATLVKLLEGRDSGCTTMLVNDIKKLEAGAAKGCQKSSATLASFEKKLPQPKAKPAKAKPVKALPKKVGAQGECPFSGEGAAKPASKTECCGACSGASCEESKAKPVKVSKKAKSECSGSKAKSECSGSKAKSGTKL